MLLRRHFSLSWNQHGQSISRNLLTNGGEKTLEIGKAANTLKPNSDRLC